jgi:hypothetical protein
VSACSSGRASERLPGSMRVSEVGSPKNHKNSQPTNLRCQEDRFLPVNSATGGRQKRRRQFTSSVALTCRRRCLRPWHCPQNTKAPSGPLRCDLQLIPSFYSTKPTFHARPLPLYPEVRCAPTFASKRQRVMVGYNPSNSVKLLSILPLDSRSYFRKIHLLASLIKQP